ncbi:MAG: protein kinase domain-containing protein [Gemmatimonas sp.]
MPDPKSPPPSFPNGEYEIESVVGKGGMAIVYRARDTRHPRLVAIKVLRPEVAQSIGTTRFLREIAVAAPFQHPHILPLIDSGELTDEQGRQTPYYVMPLVDGETLHQKLVREGRLPIATVLRITREILEALQYAHAQGVVHRDIKPANILLSGGHAVVADFGVSRPVAPTEPEPGQSALTVTGDVIGTPSYMSPEQAMGKPVDARSDLFSVGCVMYEMLVGDRPFDTPIPQYTATKKRHGIFASARDARPEVTEALDAVLAKALKPDPDERFASAAAFLFALSNLEERDPSGWGMLQAPVPNWMRNVAIGALAVVGIVAATIKSSNSANADDTAAAPPAIASDKSRVAVLPIEQLTPDSTMAIVANGFQTDLIDELAQYPALTVISKNGVLQFRGDHASTDSIARVLNVGSVVTGDIRHVGDSVRVTIRLIDGATGVVRSTAQDSGSIDDLLAVRSSVINSVTEFLRKEIGNQVRASERSVVSNVEAWELQQRIVNMSEGEIGNQTALAPRVRAARFASADSMLLRAASLDARWAGPLVSSASIHMQRANIEDQVSSLNPSAAHDDGLSARLRMMALERANDAVSREPTNARALYAKGKAEFELWRTAKGKPSETLRLAALDDLRKAVAARRDMALAWADLSSLLQISGEYQDARAAADSALKSDAFLAGAPSVMARLMFTSLALNRVQDARTWCAEGKRRYPNRPEFWTCDFTIVGWTGRTAADVSNAWSLLEATESRDTLRMLASASQNRRMLVASVAARAGMADSARAIVRLAHAIQPADPQAAYAEAYVQVLLGDHDRALLLLEEFLRTLPSQRMQLRNSPWFTALNGNPRFAALTAPQ